MKKEKKNSPFFNYARYTGMAFEMIAIILVGVFIGIKIDERVNIEFPIFTLFFTLFSVFFSMYRIIKSVNKK